MNLFWYLIVEILCHSTVIQNLIHLLPRYPYLVHICKKKKKSTQCKNVRTLRPSMADLLRPSHAFFLCQQRNVNIELDSQQMS